jgi:hypothetical protein
METLRDNTENRMSRSWLFFLLWVFKGVFGSLLGKGLI